MIKVTFVTELGEVPLIEVRQENEVSVRFGTIHVALVNAPAMAACLNNAYQLGLGAGRRDGVNQRNDVELRVLSSRSLQYVQ